MLGFSELHHLVPRAGETRAHRGSRGVTSRRPPSSSGEQSHVRYLKISEGCDQKNTCAFCAIPLMRGKHRSEPLARLVREAQQLEAQGREGINLVARTSVTGAGI